MNLVHRVIFALQSVLAELIFLAPAGKRRYFSLRYPAAALFSIAASCLFVFYVDWIPYALARLLRMVLVFSATVAAMYFCFELKLSTLFAACVSGYALQHISFHITKLIGTLTPFFPWEEVLGIPRWEWIEYLLFPVLYLLFALTIGRYLAKSRFYESGDLRLNSISLAIVVITIGFTRISEIWPDSDGILTSCYAIASCLMALAVQWVLFRSINLEHENSMIRRLWQEDRRQYELGKKEIEIIHVKHHDLKKRLAEINTMLTQDEINTIADAVDIYDRKISTGNDALDVLLTKVNLLCKSEGIMLTYTGNGSDFSFMSTMDVYSLFGNAVDNAIEAVRKLDNPAQKTVDIKTGRIGSMITITVTNYFAGSIRLKDGLPATTKQAEAGFHGFGMKSMQMIAEKYHGSLQTDVENDLFTLVIYLFDEASSS